MASKRPVRTVRTAKAEILAATDRMSDKCVSGMLAVLEILEDPDDAVQPDLDDLFGSLTEGATSVEVYALRIPKCKSYRVVISVPSDDQKAGPISVHGPLRSTKKTGKNAAALAAKHLKFINPVWEATNES